MTLTESIGSGSYVASGLQTNVGSQFTLMPGEYSVSIHAASTDWSSTGIAEMQMIQANGDAIGLGGSEKSGKVKTTGVNSKGIVEVAGGTFKFAITAPAANVLAEVARIIR